MEPLNPPEGAENGSAPVSYPGPSPSAFTVMAANTPPSPGQDAQTQAQLQLLSRLESDGGKHPYPIIEWKNGQPIYDTGSKAYGTYHAQPAVLIDAAKRKLPVHAYIAEQAKDYDTLTNAEKIIRLENLRVWSRGNRAEWDHAAEQAYIHYIRDERSGGDPVMALARWLHPRDVDKAAQAIGADPRALQPQDYQRFVKELTRGSQESQRYNKEKAARKKFDKAQTQDGVLGPVPSVTPADHGYNPDFVSRLKTIEDQQQTILDPSSFFGKPAQQRQPKPPPKSVQQPVEAENAFEAYAQDAERAKYVMGLEETFGKEVSDEAKSLFGLELNNTPSARKAHTDQFPDVEADPMADVETTFFTDTSRQLGLDQVPGMQSTTAAADFLTSLIGGLLTPSDPVDFVTGGAVGGSIVRKGAKRGGPEIDEKAFKAPIDAKRAQTEARQVDLDDAIAQGELDLKDLKASKADPKDINAAANELKKYKKERNFVEMQLRPEPFEQQIATMDSNLDVLKKNPPDPANTQAVAAHAQATKTLTERRDKLAKKLHNAVRRTKPVPVDEVNDLIASTKAMVASTKLSDEFRQEVAKGMVYGKQSLLTKAEALDLKIGEMTAAAQAAGVDPADIAAATKDLRLQASKFRKAADFVGEKKVNIGTILAKDIGELSDIFEKTARDLVLLVSAKKLFKLTKQHLEAPLEDRIDSEHAVRELLEQIKILVGRTERDEAKVGQLQRIAGAKSLSPGKKPKPDPHTAALIDLLTAGNQGMSISTFSYQFQTLVKSKHRMSYLNQLLRKGSVVFNSLEDVYLNTLVGTLGVIPFNILGMLTLTPLRIMERGMARRFGDTDAVKGEGATMAKEFVMSYIRLLALGDPKLKKQMSEEFNRSLKIFGPGRIDNATAIKMAIPTMHDSWFRSAGKYEGTYGLAMDVMSYIAQLPRFAIASTDSVFRFGMKNAVVGTAVHREVSNFIEQEILKGAKFTRKEITELYAAKREELLNNPLATVTWEGKKRLITDVAQAEANTIALMGNMHSKGGRQIAGFMRENRAARITVPFFGVGAHSTRELVERIPITTILLPSTRAALKVGGAEAAAVKAKIATGSMMAASAALLYDSGILTGSGPSDPKLRKAWTGANKPGTLKVGGTYVPLQRIGMAGEILVYTADMLRALSAIRVEVESNAIDPNGSWDKMAWEAVAHMAVIHAGVASNPILFNDMQTVLRIATEGDEAALEQFITHRASSFVPASAFSQDVREYMHGSRTHADGFLNSLLKSLPFGESEGLSVARSYWGDPTENFEGMDFLSISMGLTQDVMPRYANKNAVAAAVWEANVTPPGVNKTFSQDGASIQLKMSEWNAALKVFGELKINNMYADERMLQIVRSQRWHEGTPGSGGSKAKLLEAFAAQYKQKATAWLTRPNVTFPEYGITEPSPYAQDIQARVRARAEFGRGTPQEPDFFGAETLRKLRNQFGIGDR